MQVIALLKTRGSFGTCGAGFGGVLSVIEADGDELSGIGDGSADANVIGDNWKFLQIDRRDGPEFLRG